MTLSAPEDGIDGGDRKYERTLKSELGDGGKWVWRGEGVK